jgi:hypothetical protein
MPRRPTINAEAKGVQVAGFVPSVLRLPAGVVGAHRTVRITHERILHIGSRRPAWLRFCLQHIPDTLGSPDFAGQRARGDPRRVEFVRFVGNPATWLLVSVKFLDNNREAWVNSAHPVAVTYLTRRRRAGTLWAVGKP